MAPAGADGTARRSTRKDAWKAASLRSTFGPQVLGQMESAPACGFGSAGRDQVNRCYVSQEVDKAQANGRGGNQSQGAIYKVPESLGKQFLSTRPSSAQPRFGTSRRSSMAVKTDSPGPGAYKIKSPLGNTHEATAATAPRMRFGNAQRDAADKVYVSHDHEKGFVGRDSPGPLAYNASGTLGKQSLSEWESSPTWRLGTSQRFAGLEARRAAEVPGPGQYALLSSMGRQVASTKKSLPSVNFGKVSTKLIRPQTAPVGDKALRTAMLGLTAQSSNSSVPEYHLSTINHPPSWRFGTSSRLANYATDSPGPGEYYA